jgi:putative FmdB family regulatory protein
MPIYEYRCKDCGTRFEKLVRRPSAVSEIECPSCGQKDLKQELSVFATHAGDVKAPSEAPMCPNGGCSNPGMCGYRN